MERMDREKQVYWKQYILGEQERASGQQKVLM